MTLDDKRQEARDCRRCDLWKRATQTVFGEGPPRAGLLIVGEQPGDQEDKAGVPFVGPAGALLRKAMIEAGLDPARAYITNAVKHFKWVERGKKRIHDKPNAAEVRACRYWLEAEVGLVKPKIVVALGATAAGVLVGNHIRVLRDRGQTFPSPLGPPVLVTAHPSSILRAPDAEARTRAYAALVRDLKRVAKLSRR